MVVNKTHTQVVADYLRYIPRNLRYYRQKLGITQVKLSKQCGISSNTLFRVESEETLFVGRTDVLIKLAAALNIHPSVLFDEREEMPVLRGWAAHKALSGARRALWGEKLSCDVAQDNPILELEPPMCRRPEATPAGRPEAPATDTDRDTLGKVLYELDKLPFPQLLYVSRVIAKLIEERVQEIDRRKYDVA